MFYRLLRCSTNFSNADQGRYLGYQSLNFREYPKQPKLQNFLNGSILISDEGIQLRLSGYNYRASVIQDVSKEQGHYEKKSKNDNLVLIQETSQVRVHVALTLQAPAITPSSSGQLDFSNDVKLTRATRFAAITPNTSGPLDLQLLQQTLQNKSICSDYTKLFRTTQSAAGTPNSPASLDLQQLHQTLQDHQICNNYTKLYRTT